MRCGALQVAVELGRIVREHVRRHALFAACGARRGVVESDPDKPSEIFEQILAHGFVYDVVRDQRETRTQSLCTPLGLGSPLLRGGARGNRWPNRRRR